MTFLLKTLLPDHSNLLLHVSLNNCDNTLILSELFISISTASHFNKYNAVTINAWRAA
jgi:hypothetical protein